MPTGDPPPQLYAKQLLSFGNGYPLWTPEPAHELLLRRRDGLRIGDVGVIDLENGSFDVFFNICLPREHPLHQATGVPDNFVPVALNDWDIASYPHAEYPGRVISTTSVTARTIDSSIEAMSRPFTFDFNLSASEGALLILPKGAECYKLRNRQMFKDVATRNAIEWYRFAKQNLGRIITHDSLYLITGLYKTSAWSVAAFHQSTGATEYPAQFKASQVGESNNISYAWETTRALDWRVGPQIDIGIPNQSVFISGFKIALKEGILGKRWIEVEVDAPLAQPKRSAKFSNGSLGPSSSRSGSLLGRLMSRSGGGSKKLVDRTLSAARSTEETRAPSASILQSDGAGPVDGVVIDHIPQPIQSNHPSDVVNRYLLKKEPSASVAITHDSQWSVLFEKGLLKPEDLGHNDRLEKILAENYRVISQEGAVYLRDSSIQLTDIDEATRQAWKADKLDDAEELLSRQIIRCTGTDHSALARRALIRARLRQWDAALRDAQTSLDIQPSVTAQVAQGFTLFGQGKYGPAVEAFATALRQCDVQDRNIVLLIQSIVLFEVGYHAESMASIADLIEHCPIEAKPACACVQVEMYVRLATVAIRNKDTDRALKLLERVQPPGPIHAVQDLSIISLVCGWKFDNLEFSTQQQKCEALYTAGCHEEAVESLQAMTRNLGKEIQTRRENAEWITAFPRRCLTSSEGLGDGAMTSQNYTEAISHYSVALSLGPVDQAGILIKRSKAYAAANAWNDALKDVDEVIHLNPDSSLGHERRQEILRAMSRSNKKNPIVNVRHPFSKPSATPRQYGDTNPTHAAATIIKPASQSVNPQPPEIVDAARSKDEEVDQAQNLAARRIEQQRSIHQLADATDRITSREQLGTDMNASEHDRALRDHLTDILHGILWSSREQGTSLLRERDPLPVRVSASELMGNADEGTQESVVNPETQGVSANPSKCVHDVDAQRYPPGSPRPARSPPTQREGTQHEEYDPSHRRDRPPHAYPRHHERDDDYSPERSRRGRDDDYYAEYPENAQRYLRQSHHAPRRRHSRRDQSRSPDSGRELAPVRSSRRFRRGSDISSRSGAEDLRSSLRSPDFSRPIPPPPPMVRSGTEGSRSGSLDSRSDVESFVPRRRAASARLVPRRDYFTEHPPVQSDPVPTTADVPHKRRKGQRFPRDHHYYSRRSTDGSENPGSTRETSKPFSFYAPRAEPVVPPPSAPPNAHVQQPSIPGQPAAYTVSPPGLVPTQPTNPSPLHETLLEIMREQRLVHRASINQQEEMTRQMRSFSEWLMREMQDRLSELRGITMRMNSNLARPGELHPNLNPPPQFNVGVPGLGMPPSATSSFQHYPPPPTYSNLTPYSVPPFGGTPFNATGLPHTTPFVAPPPWAMQPSYAPESTGIMRDFGSHVQRPNQVVGGNQERAPSFGSSSTNTPFIPPIPSPAAVTPGTPWSTPSPVSDPQSASSQAQGESNAKEITSASTTKSLLLAPERESPTSVVTLVQSPMSAPISGLSTKLGTPEKDDPRNATLPVGTVTEGPVKLSKLEEKRRPGTVTFGEVTYY